MEILKALKQKQKRLEKVIMKMNNFSVLMPTYDRDDLCMLFEQAVDSCLENTLLPDKIIIVIDGPVRDIFRSKIERYEKLDRILVVWLPKNVGIARALNEGLKHVHTKYVVRADADDINRPSRFEAQLEILLKGYNVCGGAICERDMVGNELAIKRCPSDHEDILKYSLRRCPFNHMAVAFEHEWVMNLGGYPDIYLKEDWALWTLLIEAGALTQNSQEIFVDATTDVNMYRRRGGVKNIVSEYYMQRFLRLHRKKSFSLAVLDFCLKSLFFAAPAQLRGFVYQSFLRDRI